MVIVSHSFGRGFVSREGEGSFILANHNGSFAYFSEETASKYNGFFINSSNIVYKTVEALETSGKLSDVSNDFHSFRRKKGIATERFFLPHHYNSLCYESSKKSQISLFLDCRKANDFRQFGRYYRAYEKGSAAVIEFIKKTDWREDGSNGEEEFRIYVAVKSDGTLRETGEWVLREYGLDKSRNSLSERHVYDALRIRASKLVIAASPDEESAVSQADYVFSNLSQLQLQQKRHMGNFDSGRIELAAAESALYSLVNRHGIYAGLPWFFQDWSRDSIIAASGLDDTLGKKIILGYMRKLGSGGRLPNVQGSPLGSSDSVGWLFLRARQLYERKAFTKSEIAGIKAALRESLELQQQEYGKNGLIYSSGNESWMDTSYDDGGREGFPVEVQALSLAAYNFLYSLTKDPKVRRQEQAMARKARRHFWNRRYLNDLAGDSTIRPNVFIASYAYPQLLSRSGWEKCFDAVLPHLWLEWGGLASIDRKHHLFQPAYTGEDNRSYHRGDSWYWINNLAAIAMSNVNRKKYSGCIRRIKEASVNDLLWKGAVGCCSELSSASEQRAEGCLLQAWSCATLVELLRLLDKKRFA